MTAGEGLRTGCVYGTGCCCLCILATGPEPAAGPGPGRDDRVRPARSIR